MNALRALALLGIVAVVAGCTTPAPPKPEPPPVAELPPASPVETSAPGLPTALTGPEAKARAQTLIRQSYESLNEGDEGRARTDLQEAAKLDPDSKVAACLLRGINADPVSVLGRESTSYTVRPGETMGRIAQRALGDLCEFYLLARYNQIKVPKQLAAGQVLRIPGKVALAPPDAGGTRSVPEKAPETVQPAAAAPAAPTGPTVVVTPPAAPAVPAAAVSPPAATESAPAPEPAPAPKPAAASPPRTAALIETYQRNAQAAFRRQDLATAIAEWDKVIALDPSNELARARRQEAIELDRRIKQFK